MTADQAGAPSTYAMNWNRINWLKVNAFVYRMQMRIAKSNWVGREIPTFEGLEPYDGKLSSTVLRGRRAVRPLATR